MIRWRRLARGELLAAGEDIVDEVDARKRIYEETVLRIPRVLPKARRTPEVPPQGRVARFYQEIDPVKMVLALNFSRMLRNVKSFPDAMARAVEYETLEVGENQRDGMQDPSMF